MRQRRWWLERAVNRVRVRDVSSCIGYNGPLASAGLNSTCAVVCVWVAGTAPARPIPAVHLHCACTLRFSPSANAANHEMHALPIGSFRDTAIGEQVADTSQ